MSSTDGFQNKVASIVIAGDPSHGHILINQNGMFAYDTNGALFWELLFGTTPPQQVIQATGQLQVASITPLTTAGLLTFSDISDSAIPARLYNDGMIIPYGQTGEVTAATPGGTASVTGSVVFATAFPAGFTPRVVLTARAFTDNTTTVVNYTGTPSNTGFNWRYALASGALIPVGSAIFQWHAFLPDS